MFLRNKNIFLHHIKSAEYFWYILIIQAIIIFDQWVKYWVVHNLKTTYATAPLIQGIVELRYAVNYGAALGMMENYRWIFMTTTFIMIIAAQYLLFSGKLKRPLLYIPAICVIGGGIGNMIDRLFRGYVVDMFNFQFVNFAVFNIADIFITAGAALIALYVIVSEIEVYKRKKKSNVKIDSN